MAALAFNTMNMLTYIGPAVTVDQSDSVTVEAQVGTLSAEANLLAAAAGAIAVNVTVALVKLNPTLYTFIGYPGSGLINTAGKIVSTGAVKVNNQITSVSAKTKGLAASVSYEGSGNATLSLAFNHVTAIATIRQISVKAGSVSVTSDMTSTANAVTAVATVSEGLSAGASIIVGQIKTVNEASIQLRSTDTLKLCRSPAAPVPGLVMAKTAP